MADFRRRLPKQLDAVQRAVSMQAARRASTVQAMPSSLSIEVVSVQLAQIATATAALILTASACSNYNNGFPPPPRNPPVVSPALLSQDGRVITVRAARACGHRPRLIARSYQRRVTLLLINPDISCNAEAIAVVSVSVTLAAPLGNRRLAQAHGGQPIRYHLKHGS
jgi:hypothetical protein